jgi:hypothetical protein
VNLTTIIAAVVLLDGGLTNVMEAQEAAVHSDNISIYGVQFSDKPPIFTIAGLWGRSGAASGVRIEGDVYPFRSGPRLLRWVSLGGDLGSSGISGYQQEGATATLRDHLIGAVASDRIARLGRFTFLASVEVDYYGDKVLALYSDGYGDIIPYRDSNKAPLVTLGPILDIRLWAGLSAELRFGKNLGTPFPATTFDGVTMTWGLRMDGDRIIGAFKKIAH